MVFYLSCAFIYQYPVTILEVPYAHRTIKRAVVYRGGHLVPVLRHAACARAHRALHSASSGMNTFNVGDCSCTATVTGTPSGSRTPTLGTSCPPSGPTPMRRRTHLPLRELAVGAVGMARSAVPAVTGQSHSPARSVSPEEARLLDSERQPGRCPDPTSRPGVSVWGGQLGPEPSPASHHGTCASFVCYYCCVDPRTRRSPSSCRAPCRPSSSHSPAQGPDRPYTPHLQSSHRTSRRRCEQVVESKISPRDWSGGTITLSV